MMSKPSPTVEVIVCTFNGERFIDEQLFSIRKQSRQVDWITVRDDGSSDRTLRHLERHASADGRLRLVRNPQNLGYAQNFGQGLAQATGDIVFLSDQDDIWAEDKVARMLALFDDPTTHLTFSDGTLIDAKSQPVKGPNVLHGYGLTLAHLADFQSNPMRYLLRRNFINGAAMALRRTAAQSALPIPSRFPHDYWLALWLARTGGIRCLHQPLYAYRQHDANLIGSGRSSKLDAILAIWRNPSASRRLELERTRVLLNRLPENDHWVTELRRKHDWLAAVVEEPSVPRRLLNIGRAVLNNDYAHFRVPSALRKDILACLS
jgi:glycosyltransferase involved in cell wall biosynthesis